MSNIGLEEEVTSYGDFSLVSVEGGGGYIYDCDGDRFLTVAVENMTAAEQCFPLIIGMYQLGHGHGRGAGKANAQARMREALGL